MKGYECLTIGQIKDKVYKSQCPEDFGIKTAYSKNMPERRECVGDCDGCWASELLVSKSKNVKKAKGDANL